MVSEKIKLTIGVEIEALLNLQNEQSFNLHMHKGCYGHGKKIKGLPMFDLQDDGSLHTNYGDLVQYSDYSTIEMVSKTYNSKRELINALKKLKEFIAPNNQELKDCMFFNNSCGCHIHFSASYKNKPISFYKMADYKDLVKLRKEFTKRITESTILEQETKDAILMLYFRRYAKKTPSRRIDKYPNRPTHYKDTCRTVEFNFCSEHQGKGLEWRSVNLFNVTTWKEFFEVFNIVHGCLMMFCKDVAKEKKTDTITNLNSEFRELSEFWHKSVEKNALQSSTITDLLQGDILSLPKNEDIK